MTKPHNLIQYKSNRKVALVCMLKTSIKIYNTLRNIGTKVFYTLKLQNTTLDKFMFMFWCSQAKMENEKEINGCNVVMKSNERAYKAWSAKIGGLT